jgi:hypothetical protein
LKDAIVAVGVGWRDVGACWWRDELAGGEFIYLDQFNQEKISSSHTVSRFTGNWLGAASGLPFQSPAGIGPTRPPSTERQDGTHPHTTNFLSPTSIITTLAISILEKRNT